MSDPSQPDTPSAPPDPFQQGHANYVTVVENFRSYRRAGASWMVAIGCQVAVMLAGHIAASGDSDNG